MTALSAANSFSNFRSKTINVPTEVAAHNIQYVIAGAQQLSLGDGTTMRRIHHPVASVSRILRSIYLHSPYPTIAKDEETAPVNIVIGHVLEFNVLKTFAEFFRVGPSRCATTIHQVRFLSVSYIDNETVGDWWQQTTDYACEAFELLYRNWNLMRVSELQICLLGNMAYAFLWYLYGPVEDTVVLKTLANEEITEDLSEVDVIWLVIEAEGTSVVEVNGKLVGQAMAKDF
ncbi:hypothetical protein V500_10142, partial [Pseudogymnoascus sp. VKM F-4518 (FW-2643)]